MRKDYSALLERWVYKLLDPGASKRSDADAMLTRAWERHINILYRPPQSQEQWKVAEENTASREFMVEG